MLITKTAIKWKQAVFLLMMVFIIFGSSAYISLPREANPDVPIPYIFITTIYSGVSPTDMESLVTFKIENKLRGIEGVKEIISYSAESVSNISIEFNPDVDVDMALQRVRDKVDQAKSDLPQDLTEEPIITEISMSDFPVFVVAISGDVPEHDLKKIADEMQDKFESIKGVLEVDLSGTRDREILIVFDYERLQSYSLTMNDLANAVQGEHINIPGGSLDIGRGKYLVRIPGEYTNAKEIEDIVVTVKDGIPVYLRDVARVLDSFEDKDSYASLNGVPAISVSIKKRVGANILEMAEDVKNAIKDAEAEYPPAVKFTLTTDISKDIKSMVNELENNMITGFILVFLVLFLFLGKLNSLFAAVIIPFSMIISFMVLQALGITLNMLVLFSLIMALGMLVDNAIVIVENIYRHMQEGKSRVEAAVAASEEIGWPVVASTLTTVFAFLPMAFWPGVIGGFMKFLPITLIITLLSSLFVALVFNPVISSTFMRVNDKHIGEENDLKFGKFIQFYMKTVDFALNHRITALFAAIFFVILPMFLFGARGLGVEFFPESDPARVFIRANAPEGTNAATTNGFVNKFREATLNEKDIKLTLGEVGGAAADFSDTGGTSTHRGRLTIEFVDFEDRNEPSPVTINRIRERLNFFPGAEVVWEKEEMGPPTGAAVSIEISGRDVDVLGSIAAKVKKTIEQIPGLVDLKDDYVKSKPEIRIDVDREKAALLGLNTSSIAQAVRGSVYGIEVGKYREGDDEYDIKVRLPDEQRQSIDDIKNLMINTPQGKYVPISSVADVTLSAGFGTITRIDFKRVVNVTANAEGRSSVEVMQDVMKILKDFELPSGYTINYTGETEDQQEAGMFLGQALLAALFLILMVLLIEFNSVSQTFIILFTIVLSIGGIFWGLVITNTNFGIIMTGIGTISLAGVVINNGIVLIDYTNQLRAEGMAAREAIIRAGAVRFRPVMLTAWTTFLGMLPMATGYGIDFKNMKFVTGAEMSQYWGPMANAVIFGLAFSTMLTLIIVPVLYSFTGGGLKKDENAGDMQDTEKQGFLTRLKNILPLKNFGRNKDIKRLLNKGK